MHFDTTINLGEILTIVTACCAGFIAWTDLRWRVHNLEVWRKEHMIDADARDKLLQRQGVMLDHLRWQSKQLAQLTGHPIPRENGSDVDV